MANNAVTDEKLHADFTATTQSASDNSTSVATTAYVTTAIANLADSAPSTLNTLNELAAALGDDANFSTTVTNSIATKVPLAGGTMTGNLVLSGSNTGTNPAANGHISNELKFFNSSNTDNNLDGIGFFNSNNAVDARIAGVHKSQSSRHGELAFLVHNGSALTERVRFAYDGNVGIGTSSPQAPLHVSHATAPNFRLSRTGTGQIYQFGIDSSGRFLIQEAASEGGTRNSRFVIDDSGEVGIGSTAPDANLQIMNNDGSSYRFGYGGSSDVYLDADNVYIRTDNGGANTATFTTTGLGIGTTSPSRPLEVTGSATNFSGEIKVNNSSSASGAHGAIQFVTEGESSGLIIGKHSSGFSEPDLAFIYNELNSAMQFGTNNTERMRIDSSGKVGIATTSPSTALDILASTNSTNSAVYPVVTIQNTAANSDNSYAGLNVKGGNGQVNGFILADGRSSANVFSIRTETATPIQFNTNGSERMRIDSSGNLLIGKTVTTFGTAGIRFGSNGNSDFTRDDGNVINLNRTTSNGSLIGFYQDGTEEGNISVSGTNVYYNGFTGTHESSGIAADTAIGTVCSTIDELDTYVSGNKEGQTRTDHAKIKVSDTVGDSRVYGILSGFTETDNKPIVASVGIGSVLVTGSCTGGDLLESNGDGTAKVQDDDIIKSKTIGKVTIGNSDTNVKLVSCVLYCG